MKKGIASGGPRDGIMLAAQESWDGRIKYPDAVANSRTTDAFYPGHYRWNNYRRMWVWRNTAPEPRCL